MKLQIRQSVFETNSSSTHVLSVYKKEEWEAFKNGGYMEMYLSSVIPEEEVREMWEENKNEYEDFDEWVDNEGFYTYNGMVHRYDVLEEEVPDSDYVAVSIEGWD